MNVCDKTIIKDFTTPKTRGYTRLLHEKQMLYTSVAGLTGLVPAHLA